ncbi:Uncharacterized protein FWK35_00035140, partial [Aphis craccivora]
VQNCTTQNLNAVDRMSHENESIQNNDSIPQKNHYNNCISLDTALTSFQDSALKFTISLISNSNFSRKNAFDIQRGIEESLIKPMVNLLNEFLKDTIKMPAMLSQFNKITSILSNPFEWCNSEYKLNNWLSENNLYEEARQFTINSETNLVYNSGEKIYGDNIAKAALIKTVNMKDFGNNLSLQRLIDEFNDIEVNGLFIGDNLALNSISEFSKSFSANYFCRFCKAHKSLTHTLCEENDSLLQTGIYSEAILNNITSFHVVKNFSVDVMHDVFEGICHYNMCHIINCYTELVKVFSLGELNFRKQNFNYGCIEIGNMSPPIETIHLKNFHLKMSAREMMTFVHYFSLIVGDLVPEDDAVWLFYLNFLEIVDTLLSTQFTQNSILLSKNNIKQHNSDYILLFQDNLKPKHHLLTHYPTIILNSGPPKHFWCLRYEAKHKEMKIYAHVITSRKNISITLAKKFQYKFINNILNNYPNECVKEMSYKICTNHNQLIQRNLGLSVDEFDCYSQVELKGTTYKIDYLVSNFTDELCLYEIFKFNTPIIYNSDPHGT